MARIVTVKVHPKAKSPGVEKTAEREFKVRVQAAREKGRANREVLERLADFLGIPPSRLTILRGETASVKTIRIEE